MYNGVRETSFGSTLLTEQVNGFGTLWSSAMRSMLGIATNNGNTASFILMVL